MNGLARQAALEAKLAGILSSYDARSDTSSVQFCLASPTHEWMWEWNSPSGLRQYFIASITKLFVAAIVMQLCDSRQVDLDTEAAKYLDRSIIAGIHVLRGKDSSERITVRELLSHTSGIADYFEQKRPDGRSQFADALASDFAWSLEDILQVTKQMKPRFAPSSPGKAFYSDTNYQLLGAIIESVTGDTFEHAVQQRIIGPLHLTHTFPFTAQTIQRYTEVAPMLYGTRPVVIPKVMASVRADGGIVSTARDGIQFLQAFMAGAIFPRQYLDKMQQEWRRIFTPLQYGMGIMRFALPRYFSPFRPAPPMVGHSGASGAVLFFAPDIDLFVSGTVNQLKKRSLPYNLMIRLAFAFQDALAPTRTA